jgi:hypothetical protein
MCQRLFRMAVVLRLERRIGIWLTRHVGGCDCVSEDERFVYDVVDCSSRGLCYDVVYSQ